MNASANTSYLKDLPEGPFPSPFASIALAIINGDTDRTRREITAIGFLEIVRNRRGKFPNVRPAPHQDVLDKLALNDILKRDDADHTAYVFCADDAARNAILLSILDKETGRLVCAVHH